MAPAPLTRCAFAAAVLACAAPLLAGCGSTPAGSAGSPPATRTVTDTVTPSSSSPSATPTTASPSTPAGPPTCQASGLRAKLGLSQGAAGSTYQVIDFTNVSGATCTMYGYPGVSFVTGPGGSQIGLTASRNPTSKPKQITLAPGDVVNAVLQVVDALNFPKKDCLPVTAHWLRIYPPGDYSPLYLRYSTQACSKANKSNTSIQPILKGSGGNS